MSKKGGVYVNMFYMVIPSAPKLRFELNQWMKLSECCVWKKGGMNLSEGASVLIGIDNCSSVRFFKKILQLAKYKNFFTSFGWGLRIYNEICLWSIPHEFFCT